MTQQLVNIFAVAMYFETFDRSFWHPFDWSLCTIYLSAYLYLSVWLAVDLLCSVEDLKMLAAASVSMAVCSELLADLMAPLGSLVLFLFAQFSLLQFVEGPALIRIAVVAVAPVVDLIKLLAMGYLRARILLPRLVVLFSRIEWVCISVEVNFGKKSI